MTKKTLVIISLCMFLVIGNIMAQTVNADLVIPTAEHSKIMLGASGTYIYEVNGGIGMGVNAGIRFSLTSDYTYFQIPIMAVGRYYINGDGNGFFPEAHVGLVHSRLKSDITFGSGSGSIKSSSTNFGFSVGAGYKIEDSIEISARYENIMSKNAHSNIIAFRVGYSF